MRSPNLAKYSTKSNSSGATLGASGTFGPFEVLATGTFGLFEVLGTGTFGIQTVVAGELRITSATLRTFGTRTEGGATNLLMTGLYIYVQQLLLLFT